MRTLDLTRWMRDDLVEPGSIEIRDTTGKVVGSISCRFHLHVSADGSRFGVTPTGYASTTFKVTPGRYHMAYVLADGTEVADSDLGYVYPWVGRRRGRIIVSDPIIPPWAR